MCKESFQLNAKRVISTDYYDNIPQFFTFGVEYISLSNLSRIKYYLLFDRQKSSENLFNSIWKKIYFKYKFEIFFRIEIHNNP